MTNHSSRKVENQTYSYILVKVIKYRYLWINILHKQTTEEGKASGVKYKSRRIKKCLKTQQRVNSEIAKRRKK